MKKSWLLSAAMLLCIVAATAQEKFYTKSGNISFYSKAPMENIEANNKSVTTVLDSKSGALQFAVLMRGFEFEKALMQEHFNENYVESDKYPKAEFRGMITNNAAVDYKKDAVYPVQVKGKLTLHGVTKEVETNGTITVKNGKLFTDASFPILLSDYNISIPGIVKDKISKTVNIKVNCVLDVLKA